MNTWRVRILTAHGKARRDTFLQPYTGGIPGQVRVIYMPYFGIFKYPAPTRPDGFPAMQDWVLVLDARK